MENKNSVIIKNIKFLECEHYGDLKRYLGDVRICLSSSGGTIIYSDLDEDEYKELGYAQIRFENEKQRDTFVKLFSKTETFHLSV